MLKSSRAWRALWFRGMLLVLPWLIIAVVPQFREQVYALSTVGKMSDRPIPWVTSDRWIQYTEPGQDSRGNLSKEVYEARYISGFTHNLAEIRFLRLAEVSNRYPREAWVIAFALRYLPYRDGRYESQLDSLPQLVADPSIAKNEFTPHLISAGMRLIERGQQLEPNNAYFDWMKVRLLLAARRDREALHQLTTAAAKTHYNEHLADEIAACQGVHRHLFPEEEMMLASWVELPHLSMDRQLRRNLHWRVAQLERLERYEESLAIERALRRIGAMQAKASIFWLSAANGTSGIQQVWGIGERRSTKYPLELQKRLRSMPDNYTNYLAQRYCEYLHHQQRRDLIPEVRAQQRLVQAVSKERDTAQRDAVFARSNNIHLTLIDLSWFGAGFSLLVALVSCALWLLLLPVRLWRGFLAEKTNTALPSRQVFYPQVFSWGGAAITLSVSGYMVAVDNLQPSHTGSEGMEAFAMPRVLCYTAYLLPLLAAGLTSVPRTQISINVSQPKKWRPNFDELGLPPDFIHIFHQSVKAFFWILLGMALLTLPATVACYLWQQTNWDFLNGIVPLSFRVMLPPIEHVAVIPLIIITLLCLFRIVWQLTINGHRVGAVVLMFMCGVGRTAGYCVVVFSCLLLGFLWSAVPTRITLDQQLETFLATEAIRANVGAWAGGARSVEIGALPPIPKLKFTPPVSVAPGDAPPIP